MVGPPLPGGLGAKAVLLPVTRSARRFSKGTLPCECPARIEGGASRKWNLDFACKAFGVESPKESGLDGYAVGHYYRENRLREIALYCRRDVEATAGLFQKLEKTLLPALEDARL